MRGLVMAAALAVTFGAAAEPVTIEVGSTSLPSRLKAYLDREIQSFERAHPDIRVETADLTVTIRPFRGTVYEAPRMAANVVGIEGAYDGELQYLVTEGLLAPIESFLPDEAFSAEDYFENQWDALGFEGRHWGVPFIMDSMWLFVDTSRFEEAGIAEAPKTWVELQDIARRLTVDSDKDGTPDRYGLYIPPGLGMLKFLWQTLDRQSGVAYLQDGRPTLTSAESIANLEFVRALVQSGVVYNDPGSRGGASVKQLDPAMLLVNNHIQYLDAHTEFVRDCFRNRNYRAVPLPTNGRAAFHRSFNVALAVRRSAPEKERASWEFVKWMTRKDVPLPDFWFGNPCRRDFLERDDVKVWSASFCRDWEVAFQSMATSDPGDVRFSRDAMYSLSRTVELFVSERIDLAAAIEELERIAHEETIARAAPVKVDALFE